LPLTWVLGAGIVLMGMLPPADYARLFPILLTGSVILIFTIQMNRYGIPGALTGVASGGFSLLYVAAPLSLALQVLQIDRLFLFFALLLIWTADSGAYFVGRRFGKHKLAPELSPKKTVEGLLGGIASCALIGVLFKYAVPAAAFEYHTSHVVILGAIIGILAPVGDLAESVLKRDAGVKDSGTGLGGHGGVLDRIDSMLFCMPIYYAYLRYLAE
jgi:CDP-diglyceride synthetase